MSNIIYLIGLVVVVVASWDTLGCGRRGSNHMRGEQA
jgi:hypothetical protein